MSSTTRKCPRCATPVDGSSKFCGACGQPLVPAIQHASAPASAFGASKPPPQPPAQPAQPPPAARPPNRTMMGVPMAPDDQPTGVAGPAPKPAGPPRAEQRTMLGMPQPPKGAPPPEQAPQAPAGTFRPSYRPKPPPADGRTMLGVPLPPEAKGRSSRPPSTPPPGPEPQRPSQAQPPAPPALFAPPAPPAPFAPPPAQAGPSPASAGGVPPPPRGAAIAPNTQRTMLGVAGLGAQGAAAPPTDAGAGAYDAAAPPIHAPRERASVGFMDEPIALPSRSYRTPLIVLAIVAALVVLTAAVIVAARILGSGGPALSVRVVSTRAGEGLEVSVPDAEAGTKVRFGRDERTLARGRAILPLTSTALAVGDNSLELELVDPDGSIDERTVTLHVDYRVRASLDALDRDPPAIDIVVDVPAGARVLLDGRPLALDARGHGVRHDVIRAPEDSAVNHVDHVVRYAIQARRLAAAAGEVRTRIQFATLIIDRPGANVVTDRTSVEIAGAVDPAGRLTIDGAAIQVHAGRFVHAYPLPRPGLQTPTIVARAPRKAPRTQVIHIRRVEDLAAEAASFELDRSLTYARVEQNPSIYRGQSVAFEGRVYNVEVQAGRSVIQMLVRDCPRAHQCSLWVTYPAATDSTVGSWIRVLGTIAGEQQFRAESGRIVTVPRVDASFVLPAQEHATRRRRR